jgi:hypothetical protein
MGVVVSSTVRKNRYGFTGNIVKIVVVRTDAGYSPDPYKPGTGTVVAVFCG